MAKNLAGQLRKLAADPSKWTPEQLESIEWGADNLTPSMLEVAPELVLIPEPVTMKRADPAQSALELE